MKKFSVSGARGGRCWSCGASRIRNVPFELSDSLMRQMPLAQLLAVEDAGHLPQWEQPDIVQPAVIKFLREVQP